MQAERIDHMFNFTFEKSSDEIKAKASAKRTALLSKVEERKTRIKKTREEYKVTDEVLSNILMQMRQAGNKNVQTYSVSNYQKGEKGTISEEIVVPAGVVNNILTEQDYIAAEVSQAEKLDIIWRNLKDLKVNGELKGHELSYQELTYLGF